MRYRLATIHSAWRTRPSRWPRLARKGHSRRGQTLAEFAIVLPVLIAMLGGVIQFGFIFWAQNTLTQVVRDTGRWASTQQYTGTAGQDNCTGNEQGVVDEANAIAKNSSLLGYQSGSPWTLISTTSSSEGVAVEWQDKTTPSTSGDTCSPPDNAQVWIVTIKINHAVPVFLPGLQYLPGIGSNGQIMLSSTAQFRMEPAP